MNKKEELIETMKPDILCMTQYIGKGEFEKPKVKFEMVATIPNNSLIITFEDPKQEKNGQLSRFRYRLNQEVFIRMCLDKYCQDLKN